MPDNSGWMGDPNDIAGYRQFLQSKKGMNPEGSAADSAKAKLAKAKAAAAAKRIAAFTPVKSKAVVPSKKIPASPTH